MFVCSCPCLFVFALFVSFSFGYLSVGSFCFPYCGSVSVCVFIRCCGFVLCFFGDSTDVSLFLNLLVSPGLVVSCFVFFSWACVVCLRLCLDVDLCFRIWFSDRQS